MLRSLFVALSLSLSPPSRNSVYPDPFRPPLPSRSLFIYLDVARDAYTGATMAFYDGGGGDDGIVAVRVSCEGGSPSRARRHGSAISFCGSLGCG